MASYKQPDFHERAALARQAKQKAIDQLRARPTPSAAELAERNAARLKREAEAEAQRAERIARQQTEKEERLRAANPAPADVAAGSPVLSESDKKARRDARYAARKSRK
jgi:hypothetical protein